LDEIDNGVISVIIVAGKQAKGSRCTGNDPRYVANPIPLLTETIRKGGGIDGHHNISLDFLCVVWTLDYTHMIGEGGKGGRKWNPADVRGIYIL